MPLLTVPEARLHLRVDDTTEDAAIAMWIDAAEQQAAQFCGRAVFADSDALHAAIAQAPGALAEAMAAYHAAIDAATSIEDPEGHTEALRVAELGRLRAQIKSRQTHDGLVVTAGIKAAVLLIVGHLYAHREDVVTGATATQLPNGAEWLLRPYKVYA